jgi:hypothetical protein
MRSQYLKLSYSKTIWSWVEEYYNNFSCAPKKDIADLYKQKRLMLQEDDSEDNDSIQLFLTNLSNQYESYSEVNNIDFILQESLHYLKIRSGEVLKDQIDEALLENDSDKLEKLISNYKRVEKPTGQGIDLLKDTDRIVDALTNENDKLFSFPGDAGKLIGPISRGDFVCFFGPASRGKSQFLWWSCESAMKESCKVLLFTLEMTEDEILKNRAWPSISGQPKYKKDVLSAYFELNESTGKYDIIQKSELKEGNDPNEVASIQKKLHRQYRKGNIRIIFPTNLLTVEDIDSTLDNLYYYENYIPDIVVIDYADYMSPSKNFKSNDYRQTINNIWKGLAALRLKKNIAIITASHTEVKTFNSDIKIEHASEDKRKNNHISIGIALNQTEKEQDNNIIRIAMTKMREGRKTSKQVVCLQCLDIGRPCIASKMQTDVNMSEFTVQEKGNNYAKKRKNSD